MKRVLYVEDDMINRLIMEKYLASHFNTDTVGSSAECINMISNNQYDFILLDINLGYNDIDGITLMHQIRKMNPNAHTYFAAITAYVDSHDKRAILEAGFDLFHPKPIDRNQLLIELKSFLVN